jgi:hypothetical protein
LYIYIHLKVTVVLHLSDTCTIGGRIVAVDESALCADGSNTCWCYRTGGVASTRQATSKELVCGAPIRG